MLGLSLLLLLFGGLALDFWRGLALQRELASVAESAAIAAASGIDEVQYRADGSVVLDPRIARDLALSSIEFQDVDLTEASVEVSPDGSQVTVFVEGEVPVGLMGVFVDDSGVEVPYLLLVERAEVQETTVPVLILDRGIVPNQYQQVVCDLGEGNSYSNQLQLETPTQNFRRRADVLGSADGKNWLQLKTGSHIFDHHEDFCYRNLRVVYPETSYRYLKLVLWLDGGTPLEIQGMRVARVIRKEVEPEKLPARIVRKQEDVKRKATDIFLEIDLERQHLETCVLEIAQENFRRRAEVAFQSKDGTWTKVGEANI